jgi:hypothetical protein
MYIIKHIDRMEYMSLYGWKPHRDAALQFRADDEAAAYAATIPSLYGTYVIEKHKDLEHRAPPGVIGDYDPHRPHIHG